MTTLAEQAHFNNYDPSSFGWPHAVPDLVPLVFQGTNFGQCARDVHGAFMALLSELVPHIPGGINFGPHDDWAYSTTDDLPDGSWSFHRYGIAADINWRENPMGDYVTNPDAGQLGAIPHDIASAIAYKYGFEYGGNWSGGEGHRGFKDYMHFECHLSPEVARTITGPIDTGDEMTPDQIWAATFGRLIPHPDYPAGSGKMTTPMALVQTTYRNAKASRAAEVALEAEVHEIADDVDAIRAKDGA